MRHRVKLRYTGNQIGWSSTDFNQIEDHLLYVEVIECPMCQGNAQEIETAPETSAATYQYCCEDCGHEFD